jgi:RNA-directed DNA polymerase
MWLSTLRCFPIQAGPVPDRTTKSIQSLREKLRGILRTHRQATAGQVIERLNPVLRGWTNYHRHVASKRTFCAIDNVLFEQLWRWAKRRHPHKSRHWIRQKYFQVQGGRHWVFSGQDAEGKTTYLFLAGQVPIKRHVQVRGDANPYDPQWESYFEQRLTHKWATEKTGVLLHLWLEQQGQGGLAFAPSRAESSGWTKQAD